MKIGSTEQTWVSCNLDDVVVAMFGPYVTHSLRNQAPVTLDKPL